MNSQPPGYLDWSADEREAFANATRDAIDGDAGRNSRVADLRNQLIKDRPLIRRWLTLRRDHAALLAGEGLE